MKVFKGVLYKLGSKPTRHHGITAIKQYGLVRVVVFLYVWPHLVDTAHYTAFGVQTWLSCIIKTYEKIYCGLESNLAYLILATKIR